MLLRIAAPCGSAPREVEVAARWLPSQRRIDRAHRTAAGLCVLPWLGDEEAVELTVRTAGARAMVEVRRDRADGGRVLDLRLAQ